MEGVPKWLLFHVLFGAVPYFFSVALNYFERPDGSPWRSSPEILFLVVVASASALGEVSHKNASTSAGRHVAQAVLVFGIVAAAALYGAYLHHDLVSPAHDAAIDCEVLASYSQPPLPSEADPVGQSVRERWGPSCRQWEETQEKFFRASKWMAVLFTAAGALSIFLYQPKLKRGWA